MLHYEYFLIFLSFAFCGYASYTDLKTQRIRNFCSLGLLYVGTLSQLMAWYMGRTTPLNVLWLFFGGGLIAFAFYWFGVFSPGDSKLFWGLCLIFPSSLFGSLSGVLRFPPFILTLNVILPYSIGMLGYLLFRFVFMPKKLDFLRYLLKLNFQKSLLLERLFNVLLFTCIGSASTYLFQRFGWELDRFAYFVLVLVAFALIQKLLLMLPKTYVYYSVVGFVCIWLGAWTTPSVSVFLSSFAFLLGLYFVVFVIVKQLVFGLMNIMLNSAIDVSGLRVGMIPAEQIVCVDHPDGGVHYEKQQVEFLNDRDNKALISPDPAGLTEVEIAQLQNLATAGAFTEFDNRLNIQPSVCFAPVIFVGTLLTVICQGPFYLKLLQLF